jgi:phage terminase small subunit
MLNRGRKTPNELSVVRLEPQLQPSPPADLTTEQAAEWRAIVASCPAHWFGRESAGLLEAYCRHSANAKLITKKIDAFKEEWLSSDNGLKRYSELLKIQDQQHRAMALLASKMRLSQSSRTKLAKSVMNSPPAGQISPWDFKHEAAEAAEG